MISTLQVFEKCISSVNTCHLSVSIFDEVVGVYTSYYRGRVGPI